MKFTSTIHQTPFSGAGARTPSLSSLQSNIGHDAAYLTGLHGSSPSFERAGTSHSPGVSGLNEGGFRASTPLLGEIAHQPSGAASHGAYGADVTNLHHQTSNASDATSDGLGEKKYFLAGGAALLGAGALAGGGVLLYHLLSDGQSHASDTEAGHGDKPWADDSFWSDQWGGSQWSDNHWQGDDWGGWK